MVRNDSGGFWQHSMTLPSMNKSWNYGQRFLKGSLAIHGDFRKWKVRRLEPEICFIEPKLSIFYTLDFPPLKKKFFF